MLRSLRYAVRVLHTLVIVSLLAGSVPAPLVAAQTAQPPAEMARSAYRMADINTFPLDATLITLNSAKWTKSLTVLTATDWAQNTVIVTRPLDFVRPTITNLTLHVSPAVTGSATISRVHRSPAGAVHANWGSITQVSGTNAPLAKWLWSGAGHIEDTYTFAVSAASNNASCTPPLYEVGTQPTTIAAGDPVTLWARVRGITPTLGAPTVAAWAYPPVGEVVTLTGETPTQPFWEWSGTWPETAGLLSQDVTIYFVAKDENDLSGSCQVSLAIRNRPPAPEILRPWDRYLSDPHVEVQGVVRSAEGVTVRIYDGITLTAETRATEWNPTIGINWQTAITLTGEGAHDLSADAVSDWGLVSERGPTYTLFLDLYPPTVTLSALPAYTSALGLDLQWQGGDGAGSGVTAYALEHRFGEKTWSVFASGGPEYTGTPYPLHEEGVYGFRVRAVDRVGHEGLSAAQVVVADWTPPQVWINAPTEIVTGPFTVTWGATDVLAGVAYYDLDVSVDGSPWQRILTHTTTTYWEVTSPANHAAFRVTAMDRAGNAVSAEAFINRVAAWRLYLPLVSWGSEHLSIYRHCAWGNSSLCKVVDEHLHED